MSYKHCICLYRLLIVTAFIMLAGVTVSAQQRFKVERSESGHYLISAAVCGMNTEVMLESAIPAFLIGEDFYHQYMKDCGLKFEPSKAKIRLMNTTYSVACKSKGAIPFGEAIYEGPIWILEDFDDLRVPIQYLKSAGNGNATVMVSLQDGWMSVGEDPRRHDGASFKLGTDKSTGCPTVKARVALTTAKGETVLNGCLNIDFGNAMLLALEKTHKGFAKAIEEDRIAVNDARDRNGNIVAQGIYAEELSLLDKDFKGKSILIHPGWNNRKILGLLGIPFFDSTVMFDFKHHTMIVL